MLIAVHVAQVMVAAKVVVGITRGKVVGINLNIAEVSQSGPVMRTSP